MTTNVLASAGRPAYDAKLKRGPLSPAPWSRGWFEQKLLRPYNRLRHRLFSAAQKPSGFVALDDVRKRARTLTDIDEHLELMFLEALLARPRLIVELGVRGGISTFVFEKVSDLCQASLISADIEDCSEASSYSRWHFFRGDDVYFASLFPEFCHQRGIVPLIDLLFIDTSHYYDHTVQEIASWFPLLSSRAKVMFHDTNMKAVGPRADGCFALGWDNQRGVIRAIEEYLGVSVDESTNAVQLAPGWMLRHWPNCNGFTILDRIA